MNTEGLRKCSDCNDPMTERGQLSIPGIRQFQARGRCSLCYQNALKNGVIGARARAEYTDTEIKCMKCEVWKNKSDYKLNKGTVLGYEYTCRMCSKLAERYGLTYQQYLELFERQDYKCQICQEPVEPLTRRAHVDHDHSCCSNEVTTCGNCVRGILCGHCNTGLGMFRDNPEVLLRAAEYLQDNGVKSNDRKTN